MTFIVAYTLATEHVCSFTRRLIKQKNYHRTYFLLSNLRLEISPLVLFISSWAVSIKLNEQIGVCMRALFPINNIHRVVHDVSAKFWEL